MTETSTNWKVLPGWNPERSLWCAFFPHLRQRYLQHVCRPRQQNHPYPAAVFLASFFPQHNPAAIRAISRMLKVARKTVRRALLDAEPPRYHLTKEKPKRVIGMDFVLDDWVQADWFEVHVGYQGKLVKVHMFVMRLCGSKAIFARAYWRENAEATLDAHVRAFGFFTSNSGCRHLSSNSSTA